MANIYDTAILKAANTSRNGVRIKNPEDYKNLIYACINKYADKYHIQSGVIKKMVLQESGFWYKIAGSSVKNVHVNIQNRHGLAPTYREYGLLQVYPHYAAEDGFSAKKIIAYDIDENLHAGVFHIRDSFNRILKVLAKKGIKNWFFTFTFGIASYNAGVTGVTKALERGNYKYQSSFAELPAVTRRYLTNIHSWEIG